jgi:hypothetical protein
MARFFRVMLADGDRPMIGDRKNMLGVRVGAPPRGDVELTVEKKVIPGTGGMSVVRHWLDLPHFLIPPRLAHLLSRTTQRRAASGNDNARCWRMGGGEFENSRVNDQLLLRIDSQKHGLVEPINEVPIDSFQADLAETRDAWKIDEEP